ncbi:hypothetical protein K9M47_00875 [Candidatus Gracilibacteria bacterium]|nr:hypothetical protein [Candidatus Gracilibacteria bacterium]MCF7898429.1 hypothetical protein [Candidatus Paceibacterota bacterium]
MMKITTSIERSPKSNTFSSDRLLSCISAADKAIWEVYLGCKEEQRRYIEHVSVIIKMGNDGKIPHSVIVTVKIKGNYPCFKFERETLLAFDANKNYNGSYDNLRIEITKKVKKGLNDLFQNIIDGLTVMIAETKKRFHFEKCRTSFTCPAF